jgi:drug/metabolite transporter (DMT)-like permease
LTAALLALGAALCWGVGDFIGGLASRRLAVLSVLVITMPTGAVIAGLVLLVRPTGPPAGVDLALAALAGLAGLAGVAALYRGLAVGAMGVVAPLSGTAPVIPVAVGLAQGERPSALQWVGVALALAGILLVSREEGVARRFAAGAALGIAAAVAFGTFFTALDAASDEGALWPTFALRVAGAGVIIAVALAVRTPLPRGRRQLAPLVTVGTLDMTANGLFAAATSRGYVSLVSVLASLYPAVVVGLAAWFVGERVAGVRLAGAACALGGAALITAG